MYLRSDFFLGIERFSKNIRHSEKICPQGLKSDLNNLRGEQNSLGLKKFFQAIMTMGRAQQNQIIADAIINSRKFMEDDQAYKWMIDLHNEYPEDIGVFSPILLNLICLKPGQAMFLPAGELHAYLDGVGIELMANSDNVLRGGLTPKHVDVPELLNVLNFEEREIDILSPEESNECERIYSSHADEFVLSVITLKRNLTCYSPTNRSVEILLCTDGEVIITDLGNNDKLTFDKGKSIIIPSAVKRYCIEGNATLYKAAVPV
ncbi:MAG: mannose-6-phosphate isomerase, class I [Deltaproteobacteria bacterium]|nr:mannose-6-phosphate isomerase, class I [Deltaproteobacteria bacterium]